MMGPVRSLYHEDSKSSNVERLTMRTIVNTEELKRILNLLIGKPIWAVPAGGSTGSVVLIYFGEKIPRVKRCENPGLPEEARDYEAELRLMIWCAWRIEIEGTGIASGSGDAEDEIMLSGLLKLIGKTATEVAIDSFLDLLIVFSGGIRLRLFCERRTDDLDTDACYSLFIRKDEVWSVGNGVITQKRVTGN
jgi:hypothetical protein